MIDIKNSGYLVETKNGKIGRTVHHKEFINNKIPVYLADEIKEYKGLKVPVSFSKTAILCDPSSLKHLGFID